MDALQRQSGRDDGLGSGWRPVAERYRASVAVRRRSQRRRSRARGPWLRMDARLGASTPLYTYEQLERALTGAGVGVCGGAERRSPAPGELQRRRAMRSSSRSATTFTRSASPRDERIALTRLSRAEARGDVQPGRPQRRVRQEQQSVRGTSRRLRREGPHVGWQRRHPERHARLGVFRRAVRSRQSPRLLVESRLVARSRFCDSTNARSRNPC